MVPEPWFSKVAEKCIGTDVDAERGVVFSSKEQLDMYLVLLMVPEPWFSKVAENCLGADVLAERGVVCISKEPLYHYFVRNTQ